MMVLIAIAVALAYGFSRAMRVRNGPIRVGRSTVLHHGRALHEPTELSYWDEHPDQPS